MNTETRTPYRIVVFASKYVPSKRQPKRARYTAIERIDYAFMGWTETQVYQEARLPSAGSFLFPGLFAVRRAAMNALSLPETQQVSIRTNQDKSVYRYFKHSDGRISGYGGNE
jgi:hypothetical protein